MSVSGKRFKKSSRIHWNNGGEVRVVDGQVIDANICSSGCLLAKILHKNVEIVPLGGTRKNMPGIKVGSQLIVAHVFTDSRRSGFMVKRTLTDFLKVVTLLQNHPMREIVTINGVCQCSCSMEYLDGYTLLDNSSLYSPAQHTRSWVQGHSAEDFKKVLRKITQLARTINHLGVFHTDITGFNILVDNKNNIKLVDLYGSITIDSIKPSFLPRFIKGKIAHKIENLQIQKYLIEPARKRYGIKYTG